MEEIADSLAKQARSANESIDEVWNKLILLYNEKDQYVNQLISIIESSKIGPTPETKKLKGSLNAFIEINKSVDILLDHKQFNIFAKAIDDISSNLFKVFATVDNKSVDGNFLKIQTEIETLDNKINIHRQIYKEFAQSYNTSYNKKLKINNDIQIIFIKNILNLAQNVILSQKKMPRRRLQ